MFLILRWILDRKITLDMNIVYVPVFLTCFSSPFVEG